MKHEDVFKRPSWEEYFLQVTYTVAQRSTCIRRKVGAIAVRDNQILATGYNGTPTGISHCSDEGCLRKALNIPSGERHEVCRGLHAEQNVIIQSAVNGTALKGATIFCTTKPCVICTKMIINCGIKEIIYTQGYNDPIAEKMLSEAGIAHKLVEFTPMSEFPL